MKILRKFKPVKKSIETAAFSEIDQNSVFIFPPLDILMDFED